MTSGPKRTQFQRENDYVVIAEQYLKGVPQMQIAGQLMVSQGQISRDIATIQKRWSESGLLNFNLAKQKELTRLDIAEREYWEAWERSKLTLERKSTKSRQGDKGSFDEDGTQSEPRDGNPAFLDGVMKCIAQRCAILGINAAMRLAPADWRDEVSKLGGNPDAIKQLAINAFAASIRLVDAGNGAGIQAADSGQGESSEMG